MQSGLDALLMFADFFVVLIESYCTFWKLHFVQKVENAGRSFFTEKEERCHINYVICFFSTKHSFVKGNYEAIKRQFSPLQFTFVTSQTRHRECSLLNNHKKEKLHQKLNVELKWEAVYSGKKWLQLCLNIAAFFSKITSTSIVKEWTKGYTFKWRHGLEY